MNSTEICVFSLSSMMFLMEMPPPIVMTSWAADGDDYKHQRPEGQKACVMTPTLLSFIN